MAYTTIDKPDDYFNTLLYTGDGSASARAFTGVGFQPDLVWLKARNQAYEHNWYDSVRGANKVIGSSFTDAESSSGDLDSFDSDGFTITNSATYLNNANNVTHASWNWLAGGTASSNTDGSITSSVSANTTAGFSVGTFTGNGTAGATIGHGLGATPAWIICRTISAAKDWNIYHHKNTSAPETDYLVLNTTAATTDASDKWNDTAPTSSVFTIGESSQLNTSGGTSLFYAFAEKKGYSKFGSYTGNGSANGTFVYTGFKPAFVMIKQTNASGEGWHILDNKRSGANGDMERLLANSSNAESNYSGNLDLLSNGFKTRINDAGVNSSGSTYIFTAFAENPFVTSTGIPTTAR